MANDGEIPKATESTEAIVNPTQASPKSSKRKRKRTPKPNVLSQLTIRNPPWAYIHLRHITTTGAATTELDSVTAHMHITAALSQFLGLHGAAIPIDITKIEKADVWVRLPAEDCSSLLAAVGGWVSSKGAGWRIIGTSSWDAAAPGRNSGQDLFND
ncbi:hypothetical protein BAUCODRAFT_576256 [Baudoinia panamericana UAMH 10762]|uniref:Ribonucleases P/MRP subunit Pop8-like domain-containing protein n=1 Tax=Baudoinia panamericana (strain UAMH 10762) TaxID=717646 RepID=M2LQ97_BAUPA|nr:uncharacterized protein BAUCODRAFT_576256 [Baudoinia panamericana UAMH 10762]EMC96582.1 hypothetical protein BAUCODRAFT_576256 [Baudoinia panamericana UAMH 10762]